MRVGGELEPEGERGEAFSIPSDRTVRSWQVDRPASTAAKYHFSVILRSMPSPISRLQDIAEGQWGLVTLRQARAAGLAWPSLARQVDAGLLERVAHGVYRLRGAPEPDHLALRAAWLQLDPGRPAWQRLDDPAVAVVSHTSAAAIYGVGDLRADVHEFTLPDAPPDPTARYSHSPRSASLTIGGSSSAVFRSLGRLGSSTSSLMIGSIRTPSPRSPPRFLTVPSTTRALVADVLSPYSARFGLPPN